MRIDHTISRLPIERYKRVQVLDKTYLFHKPIENVSTYENTRGKGYIPNSRGRKIPTGLSTFATINYII